MEKLLAQRVRLVIAVRKTYALGQNLSSATVANNDGQFPHRAHYAVT